ncbi:spore germination protein D [Paenibacillus sp. V4I3]|uniref:spore germination lipoprotein GerD n=1 Tax=unclassified Paenibacillus TaxID=185978 RepID=UPI00278058CD|nr:MULTISPECIES: spore germination lipoprotein GerD [unclassified Paenibacillus]MDQ0872667.1 spore germination protein D [Paenibacillus sp. V4I3]MDQ0891449.1 spore germination protein D [Paenibacillus sp. V4I9]
MLTTKLRKLQVLPLISIALLLASCGSDSSSQGQGQSQANTYKEQKTMILDILKSEDGKKAISAANRSIMNGDVGANGVAGQSQIKLLSANESLQLQMAVKDVLTAKENNMFLTDMMKDPKFAGDFAKAIQKETKQMFKELLKDPEYQKSLVDVMKNPEYEKMMLDVMKTAAYRQQMMTVMEESIQSPLFRAHMVDLLKAAIAQQSKPDQMPTAKSAQKKEEGGGKGDSGGDKKKDEKSDSGDSEKKDGDKKKDDSSTSES